MKQLYDCDEYLDGSTLIVHVAGCKVDSYNMNIPETNSIKTRTVRFHSYGEPSDVLRLEETELAGPSPNRIRVRVHACGLNPADWALCRGLFAGNLPRGIGLDVSGTVDAAGEGVQDVSIGDEVLGAADF